MGRSADNDVLHGTERRVEAEHLSWFFERLGKRLRTIDRPADYWLDDFGELRRMSGGEKDPSGPADAQVADRGVRIQHIAGAIEDVLDRRFHGVVVVDASGHILANGLEIALVQPQHPLEIA